MDALRGIFLGAAHLGLAMDLSVLSLVTILCLFAGSYLFSKIQV
ncbi:MAG: hypothetical protein V1926_02565 [Candidatus Peregrinibacteria bacterium]